MRDICLAFNTVAEEMRMNLVYINSLGKIGNRNAQYGDYEFDLIDMMDLDQFDGIIFVGDNYNLEGMAEKVIRKLRTAKCPVVSIAGAVDGFYNIEFDDAQGIRTLTEHFIDHHGMTKIGFMSGYLTHPDARVRLDLFRRVMREHGMPEDGAGMFEGDFWFGKGDEAADYFLSLPERPEAIVCANDYMAIALITALKSRGINVPDDIAVSGFDGSIEGKEYTPHITTGTRERFDIARKSLLFIKAICEGRKPDTDLKILPRPIYSQSCGCEKVDYKLATEDINHIMKSARDFSYNLYDTESILLKLNKTETIDEQRSVFIENFLSIGDINSYFLMMHIDRNGRPAIDSDYISPTGNFRPMIVIDWHNHYKTDGEIFSTSKLIPDALDDKPRSFYISSTHCAERMFGYTAVEMSDKEIYNEFYNVWLLAMAINLETMLKNDRIKKLVNTLEDLSIRDGLTGMLNRRGFDELSRDAIQSIDGKALACTIILDMDGLKIINDDHGHHEGDLAIRSVANIITKCCNSGEITARAGGDEFYVFSVEYSEKKLERFISKLRDLLDNYNKCSEKPYKVDVSWGAYICEIDSSCRLEDMLKHSDALMYEQKMQKPNRRK